MTSLVRWDPFSEFRALRPSGRRGFVGPVALKTWAEMPAGFAVDVSETADDVEVRANLPGVDRAEIDLTVEDGVLTIRSEQKEESEDKGREYYRRELSYGGGRRSVRLPAEVDADKAEAQLKDGVLTVRLPKAEALKAKKIAVEAAS